MSAPSQLTHEQAGRIVQQYFEGKRPQQDWVLEAALQMRGLTLKALNLFKEEARKVTRGKPAFCVLTPTGAGKNRLKPIRTIPLSPRG